MSVELKRVLFDAYGGFADKRIRKLERGDTFIIDDRGPHDLEGYSNGNGHGHSNGNGNGQDAMAARNFCRMFARVQGENHVVLSLHERAPISYEVDQLVRSRGGNTGEYGGSTHLSVLIRADDAAFVRQLAAAIRNVAGPRALEEDLYRYGEISPRVANCLERFAGLLEEYAAKFPMAPASRMLPAPATADGTVQQLPGPMAGTLEQQMARLAALIRQAEQAIAGGGGPVRARLRQIPARSEEQNAVLKEIFNSNIALRRKIDGSGAGHLAPAGAHAA